MKKTMRYLALTVAAMMVLLLLPVTTLAAITAAPAISFSGTAQLGQVLTAVCTPQSGQSASGTLTYEWFRNDTNATSGGVSSGTSGTYTVAVSDVGKYIYVVCKTTDTTSDSGIGASGVASASAIQVPVPALSITSQPSNANVVQGSIAGNLNITAGFTNATGETPTYTWYQTSANTATGGTNIGTTDTLEIPTSLTTTSDDNKFYCVVSHDNINGYPIASVTSNLVTVTVHSASTVLLTNVTIDDIDPAINDTLTATANPSASANYVWYTVDTNTGEGTNPVQIGTGSTLAITSAYYNKYIKVVATGTGNYVGTKYAITNSAVPAAGSTTYTATITMNGTPETGSSYTPTVTTDPADAKSSLSYQWYRSESASSTSPSKIDGATSASYTPSSSDVGYYLYLGVKSNGAYANDQRMSGASSKVVTSINYPINNYLTDASTPLRNSVSSIWLYPSGGSSYYAALYTTALSSGSYDYNLLKDAAGGLTPLCAYDITLYNPGSMYGPYSIFFHLGPQYANQTFTVLHKLPTGAIEKTTVVSTSGSGDIVVRTSSLSPFMVVRGSTSGTGSGTVYVPTTDVPKTGSGENSGIIGLMVAIAALVAAAFLGRAIIRRRQNQG